MAECIFCGNKLKELDYAYEVESGMFVCDSCYLPWLYKVARKRRGKPFKCSGCGARVRRNEPRFEMPDGSLFCTDDFCEFEWMNEREVLL